MKKKECANCGKMCVMFGRSKTKDKKILCSDCAKKAGNELSTGKYTYDQYPTLVERYNENEKRLQKFNIDKIYYGKIVVDKTNNWIAVLKETVYSDKKNPLLTQKPHVYDAKDLKFFLRGFDVKKQETTLLGTTLHIDFSATMVFEDEFVPCPLNGTVEYGREVQVKGVFKKRTEGFYNEDDLELSLFANEILKENGLEIPAKMQKGDTIESLDKYAPWFKVLFELEKKNIIYYTQVENFLDGITEDVKGIFGGIKMTSEIRKRFEGK